MSEVALVKVFEKRLGAWADQQELAIAFEDAPLQLAGTTFTPTATSMYVRVRHLPATTVGQFIEGGHRALTGLFQVSIVYPKGKGAGAARAVALTLVNRFPQNLVLVDGNFRAQVTTPVSLGPTISDPESAKTARSTLPCTFSYRADVTTN